MLLLFQGEFYSFLNGRNYQPKTGNGIILGGVREKINFYVISANEAKTMVFDLDSIHRWVDSLQNVNIKVVGNPKVDTVKRFCFDGSIMERYRIEYGDTLKLVYNYYSGKSNTGIVLGGGRASICRYQFYDDKGKPITSQEYEALQKKKNRRWRKFFRKK